MSLEHIKVSEHWRIWETFCLFAFLPTCHCVTVPLHTAAKPAGLEVPWGSGSASESHSQQHRHIGNPITEHHWTTPKLEQVALRACGCLTSGGIEGQVGWDSIKVIYDSIKVVLCLYQPLQRSKPGTQRAPWWSLIPFLQLQPPQSSFGIDWIPQGHPFPLCHLLKDTHQGSPAHGVGSGQQLAWCSSQAAHLKMTLNPDQSTLRKHPELRSTSAEIADPSACQHEPWPQRRWPACLVLVFWELLLSLFTPTFSLDRGVYKNSAKFFFCCL